MTIVNSQPIITTGPDLDAILTAAHNHTAPPTVAPDYVLFDNGSRIVAVRDGYEIVTIPGETRPAQRHTFHDVDSLAAWLKRRAPRPEDCDILVDAQKLQIVASTAPYHPDGDVVSCTLQLTARMKAWIGVFGKALDQRTLIKHLRRTAVTDFEPRLTRDGQPLGTVGEDLLSKVATIEAKRTEAFQAQIDGRGVTTLQSADAATTLNVTFPPEFYIDVPVYIGIREPGATLPDGTPTYVEATQRIRVALSVDIAEQGKPAPVFTLEALDLDEARERATGQVRDHLQRELNTVGGFAVLCGASDTRPVAAREHVPGTRAARNRPDSAASLSFIVSEWRRAADREDGANKASDGPATEATDATVPADAPDAAPVVDAPDTTAADTTS